MKKQYAAPMAEKVDFDYEENVVASGAREKECNWNQNYTGCGTVYRGGFSLSIDLGKLWNSFWKWVRSW